MRRQPHPSGPDGIGGLVQPLAQLHALVGSLVEIRGTRSLLTFFLLPVEMAFFNICHPLVNFVTEDLIHPDTKIAITCASAMLGLKHHNITVLPKKKALNIYK
jgi:hypothetical protein